VQLQQCIYYLVVLLLKQPKVCLTDSVTACNRSAHWLF